MRACRACVRACARACASCACVRTRGARPSVPKDPPSPRVRAVANVRRAKPTFTYVLTTNCAPACLPVCAHVYHVRRRRRRRRRQVLLRICRSQESLLRITKTKWDTIPATARIAEEDRREKLKID